MIYVVLISLIFTGIGIAKNKHFKYKKSIGLALLVYATIFRFMLLDSGSDGAGNAIFSGGITFSGDLLTPFAITCYLVMLLGLLIYIYSDAIE